MTKIRCDVNWGKSMDLTEKTEKEDKRFCEEERKGKFTEEDMKKQP